MTPLPLPRAGDKVRVLDPDCRFPGTVLAVYPGGTIKARFPLGSPYLDDWSLFNANEYTLVHPTSTPTPPPAPTPPAPPPKRRRYFNGR